MSSEPLRVVAGVGFGRSSDGEVVVTSIGSAGNVFAGSFIGRVALYGWDFVTSIYTDKDGALYVVVIGGDIEFKAVRNDPHSWLLKTTDGSPVGTFRYDPSTGNFCIKNEYPSGWLEGALMGTYAANI